MRDDGPSSAGGELSDHATPSFEGHVGELVGRRVPPGVRDVRLVVERIRCVHERIGGIDVHADVSDPMAGGMLDTNVACDLV